MKSSKFAMALCASALFCIATTATAEPPAGKFDQSFGLEGLRVVPFNVGGNFDDLPLAMVQDSAERLLVAGFGAVDGSSKRCLAMLRLDVNGVLDASFGIEQNPPGKICHGDFLGEATVVSSGFGLAIRPDGDFFVAGAFNKAGQLRAYVCRFKPDGSFRQEFGQVDTPGCYLHEQGPAPFTPAALLLKDDSVIVVANTLTGPMVMRIQQESGDLEPFGNQSQVPVLHASVQGVANGSNALLTPDGDVIVVGDIKEQGDSDSTDFLVARFDLGAGAADQTFGDSGAVRVSVFQGFDSASNVAMSKQGNLLIAGNINNGFNDRRIGMVALDPASGEERDVFAGGNAVQFYLPCEPDVCVLILRTMIVTPEGFIALGGTFDSKMFVARLEPDGSGDSEFADNGFFVFDATGLNESVAAVVSQEERLVAAGSVRSGTNADFAVFRLSDGRLFSDQFESQQ